MHHHIYEYICIHTIYFIHIYKVQEKRNIKMTHTMIAFSAITINISYLHILLDFFTQILEHYNV